VVEMVSQNNVQSGNIVDSMNQAFDNGSFYGLEYVLDELVQQVPAARQDAAVDWFGFLDGFDQ
jgi:hypothetical protein